MIRFKKSFGMRSFNILSCRTSIATVTVSLIVVVLLIQTEIVKTIVNKANTYVNKIIQPVAQTTVLQWKANGWEQQKDFCVGNFNFEKIQLKTSAGLTPMFIHPIKYDTVVSGDLKRKGTWEPTQLKLMQKMLEKEPDAGVIDIGSQLGTYSLFAAKMGRQVIAVDPLEQNILRFCKSVQEGNLTGRVTIFFAAVSSSHKKVSFRGDPTNNGWTWIEEIPSGATTVANYTKFISDTSLLNDMLEEIHFKKAIMKIDIEGHEYQALKAADKIFKNVDIRGIIMEWIHVITTPDDAKKLVELLIGYGLRPMDIGGKTLSPEQFRNWPSDIAWEKIQR